MSFRLSNDVIKYFDGLMKNPDYQLPENLKGDYRDQLTLWVQQYIDEPESNFDDDGEQMYSEDTLKRALDKLAIPASQGGKKRKSKKYRRAKRKTRRR